MMFGTTAILGAAGAGDDGWWLTDPAFVSWWPFKVNANDAKGASHLTLVGNAAIAGPPAALALDGTGDYARRVESNWRGADSAGTLSLWIKTSSPDTQVFFCSADESATTRYLIFFVSSGLLYVSHRNSAGAVTASGAAVVADGDWHHLAIVSTGTAWIGYLDGVAVTLTGTNNGNWLADTSLRNNVVVGAQVLTSANFGVVGSIGETMYFSRAATPTEIAQLYAYQRTYYGV
jgi:hypothetical protein